MYLCCNLYCTVLYPPACLLTSSCDSPLLFVSFQVNTGVLSFLDYVEDIYYLVALSDPPQTLTQTLCLYPLYCTLLLLLSRSTLLLHTRRLFLWAGALFRISAGRLPKRIMFGNLEGAVRRGRGGKEKEWTNCVHSDIWAFGITGDWKTMAFKAEVWVEAVTEGGRRFMAAWREGRRGRRGQTSPGQERGNETGEVAIAHGSVEFCEATPIGLADES